MHLLSTRDVGGKWNNKLFFFFLNGWTLPLILVEHLFKAAMQWQPYLPKSQSHLSPQTFARPALPWHSSVALLIKTIPVDNLAQTGENTNWSALLSLTAGRPGHSAVLSTLSHSTLLFPLFMLSSYLLYCIKYRSTVKLEMYSRQQYSVYVYITRNHTIVWLKAAEATCFSFCEHTDLCCCLSFFLSAAEHYDWKIAG